MYQTLLYFLGFENSRGKKKKKTVLVGNPECPQSAEEKKSSFVGHNRGHPCLVVFVALYTSLCAGEGSADT